MSIFSVLNTKKCFRVGVFFKMLRHVKSDNVKEEKQEKLKN